MTSPTPTLSAHGASIPMLGFGTSAMLSATTADNIATALKAGYRHIDTARKYSSERAVGEGIRDGANAYQRESRRITP